MGKAGADLGGLAGFFLLLLDLVEHVYQVAGQGLQGADEVAQGRGDGADRLCKQDVARGQVGEGLEFLRAYDLTNENATLHAEVTRGAVVVAASKIDNDPDTGDPTTLEPWSSLGAAESADGSYRIVLEDSFEFAGGGTLVISDDKVSSITATYFNWDKVDAAGVPQCREIFMWRSLFEPAIELDELAEGVVVEQVYEGGGRLSFDLRLTVADNLALSGSVVTTGSGFPLVMDGCNGDFPSLALAGGKVE